MSFLKAAVGIVALFMPVVLGGCEPYGSVNRDASTTTGHADAPGPAEAKSPRDFLVMLQRELRDGERNRVTKMTHFPVQVGEVRAYLKSDGTFARHNMTLLDEASFGRQYDAVWNSETIKAVLDQSPDLVGQVGDLFVIGCGEVWFSDIWPGKYRKDGEFRIIMFDTSQDEIGGISLEDCYRARDFVRQLQAALARNDRNTVVGMLKYPLEYHGQYKTETLRNVDDALRNYDLIFSARFRDVIAKEKVQDLLADENDGIILGEGLISVNEPWERGPFKVVGIAEPPPDH
jgi:hypothetical protein